MGLGGAARSGPAPLVEFKAGRMNYDGRMVTPDRRRGVIKIVSDASGMKTFQWCDAESQNPVENFYVFPDEVKFEKVKEYISTNQLDDETVEQAEIQVKYNGYIEKERNNADKLKRLEDVKIPENYDFDKIKSLSYEAREKFKKIRPVTVSQASRISGVSPSDISILLIYMGR